MTTIGIQRCWSDIYRTHVEPNKGGASTNRSLEYIFSPIEIDWLPMNNNRVQLLVQVPCTVQTLEVDVCICFFAVQIIQKTYFWYHYANTISRRPGPLASLSHLAHCSSTAITFACSNPHHTNHKNRNRKMSTLLSSQPLFGGAISLDLPQNSIDARSVLSLWWISGMNEQKS